MHGDNAFYEKYAGYQSQKLIMVYFFLEHVTLQSCIKPSIFKFFGVPK